MIHPLRQWRTTHGITLAELAKRVGVTPSHLSEIERGRNAPSLDLARRLSLQTADETGRFEVATDDFVQPAQ